MSTSLPIDQNGNAISAMGFKAGAALKLALTATSIRNTDAFTDKIVTVHSDVAFYFRPGNASVEAGDTDHHWPANTPLEIVLDAEFYTHTHVAFRRDDTNGTLYLSVRN